MVCVAWCPKCGAEYRPGFSACADCRVPLVDHPPIPAENGHPSANPFAGRIVELTRVPRMEADVLVARLRASGLRASSYGSDTVYGSVTFAQGVPVFVAEDDLDAATALLADTPSE